MNQDPFYVTTAIPYPNDRPHVGFMYEIVAADVVARSHRMRGEDVHFLTGLDENSQTILDKAKKMEMEPGTYCDQLADSYIKILKGIGISNDSFVRTTEERHHLACQSLWKRLESAGDIYKGHYEGWYCDSCNNYWEEKDLLDGNCPEHGTKPKRLKEDNYFFALSKWQERLEQFLADNPNFILPVSRRHEVEGILKEGLRDVSFSRANRNWGVPVPGDSSQVMYVWADALVNYITDLGYGSGNAKMKYWPANIHFVGKDIIRFHCLIWPAMLMAAGLEAPRTIAVHGFLSFGGQKISKSAGNVIYAEDITKEFGVDPVRYYLMAETPYGQDGNFTREGLTGRYNADLANDLGNLLNRCQGMAQKYFGGKIPPAGSDALPGEKELIESANMAVTESLAKLDVFDFSGALVSILNPVKRANKMIEETAPWKRIKEGDAAGVGRLLHLLHETLRQTAVLLSPFMPNSSPRIWEGLGLDPSSMPGYSGLSWNPTAEGLTLPKPEALFPRIEKK